MSESSQDPVSADISGPMHESETVLSDTNLGRVLSLSQGLDWAKECPGGMIEPASLGRKNGDFFDWDGVSSAY